MRDFVFSPMVFECTHFLAPCDVVVSLFDIVCILFPRFSYHVLISHFMPFSDSPIIGFRQNRMFFFAPSFFFEKKKKSSKVKYQSFEIAKQKIQISACLCHFVNFVFFSTSKLFVHPGNSIARIDSRSV